MAGESIRRVMIGTAGHIDHGKSSLIKALTGIDPDHLKEEQERGLTIDLGRSTLSLPDGRKVGIIDVPGHERFIKNMVAGASSVDIALLVVAADDGVMPQTREHVEILTLLQVRRCLVALTKVDLVEEELAGMAREEVVDYLATTPLAGAPVLPVSAVTGQGLEALRTALVELAGTVDPHGAEGPFRLPVQRVFRKEGFGSVVGGVPVSGRAAKGTILEVLPAGQRGRVRGIQAYGEEAEEAGAGHSCALNLADLDPEAAHRGSWVVTPDLFRPAREGILSLSLLPGVPPLRSGARVRLNVGTAEILGQVLVPGGRRMAPGTAAPVRVRLDEPTLLVPGDRFILRLQAPPRTVGGGRVVLAGFGHRRLRPETVEGLRALDRALAEGDRSAYLEGVVQTARLQVLTAEELTHQAAAGVAETEALLAGLAEAGRLSRVGRGYLHAGALEAVVERTFQILRRRAKESPLTPEVGKGELASKVEVTPALMDAILARLKAKGRVELLGEGRVRRAGSGKELSGRDLERSQTLLTMAERAGHQPLTEEEIRQGVGWEESAFKSLVAYLQSRRRLERVAGVFLYSGTHFQEARRALIENCRANGELDIPALRDHLGTSRKYIIPLLEHFDGIGLTARRGSVRVLRNEAAGADS